MCRVEFLKLSGCTNETSEFSHVYLIYRAIHSRILCPQKLIKRNAKDLPGYVLLQRVRTVCLLKWTVGEWSPLHSIKTIVICSCYNLICVVSYFSALCTPFSFTNINTSPSFTSGTFDTWLIAWSQIQHQRLFHLGSMSDDYVKHWLLSWATLSVSPHAHDTLDARVMLGHNDTNILQVYFWMHRCCCKDYGAYIENNKYTVPL